MTKRVLFTTPMLEHPPAQGPTLRIENSIKALSKVAELHLLSQVDSETMGGPEAEQFYRNLVANLSYTPTTFHPAHLKRVDADAHFICDYAKSFDIPVVWFGYGNISFPLISRVKELRPELKVVCDTDSVWSRFVLRELPFVHDPARRQQIEAEGRAKEREEAQWVNLCEVTTAVSEVDADYYRGLAQDQNRIKVFSNVIDVESYRDVPAAPTGMKAPSLYLAGRFYDSNSPMVQAARWVIDEILPLVQRQVPDIHLYIVGNGANQYLADVRHPSVTVHGRVPSVLPFLCHVNVSLVPLKFESGTRFKILEAGACRIPIVSTTLGAEGLPARDGVELLLGDSAADFAAQCIRLLNDRHFASQLAENCWNMVAGGYSVDALTREAHTILNYLEKGLASPKASTDPIDLGNTITAPVSPTAASRATILAQIDETLPRTKIGNSDSGGTLQSLMATASDKEGRKDWSAALAALDQLLSLSPNTPLVHGRRARALMNLGRQREAIWAALEELARRPDDEATFNILLHDQATLVAEINKAPASTVAMVENLVQMYTRKYQSFPRGT